MSELVAERMKKIFEGNRFAEYDVGNLLGAGKTAAVFSASKESKNYALKIFDNIAIGKYGAELQQRRIDLAIDFGKKEHPNIVKIFDGGKQDAHGSSWFYLVMEEVKGHTLKDELTTKGAFELERTINVIYTLIKISKYLLQCNLAHRDIKPENIMIDAEDNLTLMDLGVLKMIGQASITDEGSNKPFIGTQRYAPPELLVRTEQDNSDGWEAINYYQIGAVAHDLIMGNEIFSQYKEPYTRIVLAILNEPVTISRFDFPEEFMQFVRNMLSKKPEVRLKLCRDIDVRKYLEKHDDSISANIVERIRKITSPIKAEMEEIKILVENNKLAEEKIALVSHSVEGDIAYVLQHVQDSYKIYDTAAFEPNLARKLQKWRHKVYRIQGKLEQGFGAHVYLSIGYSVTPEQLVELRMRGIIAFMPVFKGPSNTAQQNLLLLDTPPFEKSINIFTGQYSSEYLKQRFEECYIALLEESLKVMKPSVESKLQLSKAAQESIAGSERKTFVFLERVGVKDAIVIDHIKVS